MSHRFHVCPPDAWDKGTSHIIDRLLALGLSPESRLLDVGCGCLRIGKHLIEFLDPGGYVGVEPEIKILTIGLAEEISEKTLEEKRPEFLTTSFFRFGRLQDFDYVLAVDVFIHCGKRQLTEFLTNVPLKPDGSVVLTLNIGSDIEIQKSKPANSTDEKAKTLRFLYQHSDFNTVAYSQWSLEEVLEDTGFNHLVLASYIGNGRYQKKLLRLTKGSDH